MLYLYIVVINMDIKLEKIDMNSGLDGLDVMNEIARDDSIYGESPLDEEIDEYLYRGFLLLSEEDANDMDNPIYRYFFTLDDKKIGYADIKGKLDDETRRIGGNIGIVLLKKYRNKGLGKVVMPMLLEKAYENGLKDVLVTTSPDNTNMRKLCESLGGNMTDIDGHCHYWFKKKEKIHKM